MGILPRGGRWLGILPKGGRWLGILTRGGRWLGILTRGGRWLGILSRGGRWWVYYLGRAVMGILLQQLMQEGENQNNKTMIMLMVVIMETTTTLTMHVVVDRKWPSLPTILWRRRGSEWQFCNVELIPLTKWLNSRFPYDEASSNVFIMIGHIHVSICYTE